MSTERRLKAQSHKEYADFKSLVDEYHAEETSSDRRSDLKEQIDRAHAAVTQTNQHLEQVLAAKPANEIKDVQTDLGVIGAGAKTAEATEESLGERTRALIQHYSAPETMTDARKAVAFNRFEGENHLLRRHYERRTNKVILTDAQREAVDQFEQVNLSAIAGGYSPDTANAGGELVPTDLEARIRAQKSSPFRPLATDELVSTNVRSYFGKVTVPTLNKAGNAEVVAANTNAAITRPKTDSVILDPNKYGKATVFPAELFINPYTDLEDKIAMQFGIAFGMAYNHDRLFGDGNNKITGFVHETPVTTGNNANAVQVAGSGKITEADIATLIGKLDEAYHEMAVIMFNRATELALYTARNQGIREFDIDPVSRRLIMPLGMPYAVNTALDSLGSAGNKVAVIADWSQYETLTVLGGMRIDVGYEQLPDQFLFTMREPVDGTPAYREAAFTLVDK